MKKYLSVLFIVMILSLNVYGSESTDEAADQAFDVTDLAGRTVHFDAPAETCATMGLSNGAFMTMCALFGDEVTDHLTAWDNGVYDCPDWGEVFYKALPSLADVTNVGPFYPDMLDVESLITVDPDVVLLPAYNYNEGGLSDKIVPTIEQAGIPVVVINYGVNDVEAQLKSMEIIGKIFGKEERAKELADYYSDQIDLVFSKTDALKAEGNDPEDFYVEYCWMGAADQGLSFSNKSQWGHILTGIGASTLYGDSEAEFPEVDPEYILSSDPDGIILLGGWWGNDNQLSMGFLADEGMVRNAVDQYLARPGWNQLSAVKNGRVYALCQTLADDIFSFWGYQEAAKITYPEEFADLDPEAAMKAFFEEFMPVEYTGTWFYHAEPVE